MNRDELAMRTQLLTAMAVTLVAICIAACQPPELLLENTGPVSGMAPVNDVELYYEIHGEGVPLVLLHGGLGHVGHWENQLPVLSEHYKVIAMDSRGHGRSTMTEQQNRSI